MDTSDTQVLGFKICVDHPAIFNDVRISIKDRQSSCKESQVRNRMIAKKAQKNKHLDDLSADHHEGILLLTTKENYPKLAKEYFEEAGPIHDPKVPG